MCRRIGQTEVSANTRPRKSEEALHVNDGARVAPLHVSNHGRANHAESDRHWSAHASLMNRRLAPLLLLPRARESHRVGVTWGLGAAILLTEFRY